MASARKNRKALLDQMEANEETREELLEDTEPVKGGLPSGLIRELQRGTASANRANERRYQQALSTISRLGGQRRQDIGRSVRAAQATAAQRLRNMGLGNSTVLEPVMQRYEEGGQRSINALADRLNQQRLDVISSRVDSAPGIGPALQFLYRYGRTR
jgi:hypothetical protein